MELGETTVEGALRETIEEAGARVEMQGLFTLINVVRVGQVHLFYRARLLDTDFAPGPETIEAGLFGEAEIPWDEIAFRTTKLTLEHYFEDRRAGAGFGVHTPRRFVLTSSAASAARRRQVGAGAVDASAAMPIDSPSVGCGWIVLPMSTSSAPISMASAISPIMSPACVPTMPPPTMRWRLLVEQQLGEALVAAVGDGAARRRPREQALLDLDAAAPWPRPR